MRLSRKSRSDRESIGLMSSHFGNTAWIMDSGVIMCNDQAAFVKYEELKILLKVTLGDGYKVDAIGNWTVILTNQ